MKNNAKARRLFNLAHWISNTRRVGFREKVGEWLVIAVKRRAHVYTIRGARGTWRGGPTQLQNLPRTVTGRTPSRPALQEMPRRPGKSTALSAAYGGKSLAAQGYCRVSNSSLTVSRIDREDWREHLAESHAPWDVAGEGMTWAKGSRMGDHYRRCYSKDTLTVTEEVYRTLPASAEGPDEYLS